MDEVPDPIESIETAAEQLEEPMDEDDAGKGAIQ